MIISSVEPRQPEPNDDVPTVERRRKYSEGCREIEACHSLRPYAPEMKTEVSDLTAGKACCLSDEEEHGDNDDLGSIPRPSTYRPLATSGTRDQDCQVQLPASVSCQNNPLKITGVHSHKECGISSKGTEAAAAVVRLASPSSDRRASIITAKVFKPSKDMKLGIRLHLSNDGVLEILQVSGFLEKSPLRSGDQLERIDDQEVSAWTTNKALTYLREALGWVNISVRNPHRSDPTLRLASICKSSIQDKLGISFEKLIDDGEPSLTIKSLNVAGVLGGRSAVRVGDIVESINSISCHQLDNATTAVKVVRSIPDWVHILVRRSNKRKEHVPQVTEANYTTQPSSISMCHEEPTIEASEVETFLSTDGEHSSEPSLLSLTVFKARKEDKLGLSLIKCNGAIYIKKISGVLSDTILREGMMLLAINHRPAVRMSLGEAHDIVTKSTGSLTLLARNPHGNNKLVQAMVLKKPKKEQSLVGISFKGTAGRQLKICEIRDDGLFISSCINVGDSVLQVNGIDCQYSRPKDAVDLVRGGDSAVTILAKTKSKNAIVVARLS